MPAGLVSDDLIEFSDFFATLADLTDWETPVGEHFDGRSFLPPLFGGAGNPRDSIFVHYDRDPSLETVQFPRVRFARTKRFKLYADGRFYDVPHDWEEKRPLSDISHIPAAAKIKARLRDVLNAMPVWRPNNAGVE